MDVRWNQSWTVLTETSKWINKTSYFKEFRRLQSSGVRPHHVMTCHRVDSGIFNKFVIIYASYSFWYGTPYCLYSALYGSHLRRKASLSCINELRRHIFNRRCCFTHFFATLKLLQELQCTFLRIFTTQKREVSEFMKISVFFKLKYWPCQFCRENCETRSPSSCSLPYTAGRLIAIQQVWPWRPWPWTKKDEGEISIYLNMMITCTSATFASCNPARTATPSRGFPSP